MLYESMRRLSLREANIEIYVDRRRRSEKPYRLSEARAILLRRPRTLDRSALVFPNRIGGHDVRWVEKTFPRAVAAAQINDLRFHDLRHTFASRLRMEGVDILTIKELGGWKSLKMVERYSHIGADHRRAAIARLAHRAVPADEQTTAAQ